MDMIRIGAAGIPSGSALIVSTAFGSVQCTFDFLDSVAAWPEGFRVTRFSYDLGGTGGVMGAAGAGKVRLGLAFPVRLDEAAPPAGVVPATTVSLP